MRPRVRFITNTELSITKANGEVVNQTFVFGKYYPVDKIVTYPDGYSDIHFVTNSIAKGVKLSDAVELHGNVVIEDGVEYLEEMEEIIEDKEEKVSPSRWRTW
jgi:hypothetical protein